MKVRPLYPHPALLIDGSSRYVVVCDLHLGMEAELSQKGISMKQSQIADELFNELELLCKENHAAAVIAGDLKHNVGSITRQEWDEIPDFLRRLSSITEVFLVPGNHDSNIRNLVPANVAFASASGLTLEDVLVLHGHAMPSEIPTEVSTIVMGHVHPLLSKKTSLLHGQPVWAYLKVDRSTLSIGHGSIDLVIVPSFNKYLYAAGGIFNKQPFKQRKSISPITSRIAKHPELVEKCIISTLDGSIVGDAETLQEIL